MQVDRIDKKDWAQFSEKAHLIAFKEHKPAHWDRIDFALIVARAGTPMGFVTCREYDAHTIYWQFGGAFPGTKDTNWSYTGYCAFVEWCRTRYKRITTLIENTNTVMLKMAMRVGFRIIGVRMYAGSVLLEHVLELGGSHGC